MYRDSNQFLSFDNIQMNAVDIRIIIHIFPFLFINHAHANIELEIMPETGFHGLSALLAFAGRWDWALCCCSI